MERCKKEEPKVINNIMLYRLIEEQGPSGEAGRLARLEGTAWDEVEQLRIEFLKILRIDHLWMLTSIKKLSLSNNLIERIENLECLVNVVELDLSFNKISKIENLDTLINVEILSLFENQISILENMDTLKKLLIFTVGNNCIEEKTNVLYLRRFKNLQSLNMSGNPCTTEEGFLTFIAGVLSQITYYQYKLVPEYEKEVGIELYSDLLLEIQMKEYDEKLIEDKIQAEIEEAELHAGSFVEFLGSRHLFDQMFENDREGKAFLLMNKDVVKLYKDFEAQFIAYTMKIFEMGQKQYRIRKVEVDQFFSTVNAAKLENQRLSIEKMEAFLVEKVETFQRVKQLEEEYNEQLITLDELNETLQKYSDVYSDTIHKIWKDLMSYELLLFEQMEEVIQLFEQTLTEQINVFLESAQGSFAELRNLEQSYFENIGVEAVQFQTKSNTTEDFVIPEALKTIMSDKEFLVNALGASHDVHSLVIDTREDRLTNRAKTWLSNVVGGLTKEEITRSRGKVLEINHFLDIQREEFDDLPAFSIGAVTIDPDISAALN